MITTTALSRRSALHAGALGAGARAPLAAAGSRTAPPARSR